VEGQAAAVVGGSLVRRQLLLDQVAVVLRRPADCLARVVDDVGQVRLGGVQKVAKALERLEVAQVEPEDLQVGRPAVKVGQRREARRRIHREAGRRQDARAAPQQLERRLKANLDARASEEHDAASQVGGLQPLRLVERRAAGAEGAVQVVQPPVPHLADVARAEMEQLALPVRLAAAAREEARLGRSSVGCTLFGRLFRARLAEARLWLAASARLAWRWQRERRCAVAAGLAVLEEQPIHHPDGAVGHARGIGRLQRAEHLEPLAAHPRLVCCGPIECLLLLLTPVALALLLLACSYLVDPARARRRPKVLDERQ